ncbi:competence protein ComEC [Ramlibacter sp. RBP-2]|uniref:Competence protein ComEC n=1 Tax=Ramlibacter lithotrophicus TaxID=2606681 RepID=A0A7X6DK26_9BURK|nr:competence protein ComEC [Ramlibacter lithotrophicus]NKE68627.1 competence protein ComEC [Ramlibacter lithotrophicus]
MADFIELDFLDVESEKSGDAITVRYEVAGVQSVHVIDGGYVDTGDKVVAHLKKWCGGLAVNHVVLTHPDQDHANGLRKVLEECEVGTLWMHRPWLFADQLLPSFPTYKSVDALRSKLRALYPGPAALEDIALEREIDIKDPFQGAQIGQFVVAAPSKARYLQLIVDSDRTPEKAEEKSLAQVVAEAFDSAFKAASNLVKRAWGMETFPVSGTNRENEMSVVQFGVFGGKRVLLTGDAGREALTEAADFVEARGHALPGVWCFQVPHHGGRHNVSTELLDRWLGPPLGAAPEKTGWLAVCSSAKADTHHPKKVVVRAMLHRGAHFSSTEGRCVHVSHPRITRPGYSSIPQADYPEHQEED